MARAALLFCALSGLVAVALGAFGAHALAAHFSTIELGWWQTAVQYQFWHTLALAFAALWLRSSCRTGYLPLVVMSFIAGILLFSGSLYLLALTGMRMLVWLTPLGGCCWLLAWGLLGLHSWRYGHTLPQSLDK